MSVSFLHPSPRTLYSFAVDGKDSSNSRRVQAHLADCAQCRAEIVSVRALLDETSRIAPAHSLRADAITRVLAARAAGERVVLPTEPSRAPGRRSRLPFAIAATVLLVIVGGVARSLIPASLGAGEASGRLTFSPQEPTAGAHIVVRYRAPQTLANAQALVLRARFRTRWDEDYQYGTHQTVAARLTRSGSGEFSGAFDLPGDAVFATFAVENSDATRVDANQGRPWSILVYEKGKPSAAAMTQQFADVLDRSPDSALMVARLATTLHPESPRAWSSRAAFESYMLGASYLDSTRAEQIQRYVALDRTLRARNEVSADEIAGMGTYAVQIGGPTTPQVREISQYWRARMLTDGHGSPLERQRRISDFNSAVLRDSALAPVVLDSVERLWGGSNGDSLSASSARMGMQIARRTGDPQALLRWADRAARRQPVNAAFYFQQIASDARLRDSALARIRMSIASLQQRDDARRPLEATVADDSRQRAERSRAEYGVLGDVLLRGGDTASAVDAFARAMEAGWDVALFERAGRLYETMRDSQHAARLFAFVVADPSTSKPKSDSIAARFVGAIGDSAWGRLVQDGRSELTRRIIAGSISLAGPTQSQLVAEDSKSISLQSASLGKVSVIALWSRYCGFSRMQLPLYAALSKQFTEHGVAFIPITEEAPTEELRSYTHSGGIDFQSYYDVRGEARRALNNLATPTYYVLDSRGRIRFSGNSPNLAITQAVALQNSERVSSSR